MADKDLALMEKKLKYKHLVTSVAYKPSQNHSEPGPAPHAGSSILPQIAAAASAAASAVATSAAKLPGLVMPAIISARSYLIRQRPDHSIARESRW
jgi:hypothetical protein